MIKGLAAAALLGLVTVGLAVLGMLLILPWLVGWLWRRKWYASHG